MKSTKKNKPLSYAGHARQGQGIEHSVTARLSEKALAKEWLKPEEDRAWEYL